MSDNTTPPPGPEGQDPNANPYGQNPYGQTPPPGQDPSGQQPGQAPYYGQDPYGQQQGQNPYGQPASGAGGHGAGGYGYPAGPAPYSAGESFSWAWKQFTSNIGGFLVFGLLLAVPTIAIQAGTMDWSVSTDAASGVALMPAISLFGILGTFVSQAVMIVVATCVSNSAVRAARTGTRMEVGTAFEGLNWSTVALAAVIFSALYTVGDLLCSFPALIAWFLLMFMPAIVGAGAASDGVDALKQSFKLTTSQFAPSFLLALIAFACVLVGLLACCVGVLIGLPLGFTVVAHGWARLTGQAPAPQA